MINDDLSSDITSLYELLEDSKRGYAECAADVNDAALKDKFQWLHNQRQRLLDEFKREAGISLGEKLEEKPTIKGVFHRLFVDIKSLLAGGDKDAIIREIQNGESYLVNAYEEILLKHNVPDNLANLFRKQLSQVKTDLTSVKSFYLK
jgi:uncharacterized protein (TIGR02284 family)